MNVNWILIIVIGIVGMLVQWKLKSVFAKYSKVLSPGGLTGAQIAQKMLNDNGIYDVSVTCIKGRTCRAAQGRLCTFETAYSYGACRQLFLKAFHDCHYHRAAHHQHLPRPVLDWHRHVCHGVPFQRRDFTRRAQRLSSRLGMATVVQLARAN